MTNQKTIADIIHHDAVKSPSHYTVGGIETIDYMAAKSTPEEFRGHLRLTALKYMSRAGYKESAVQDFKKAAVYLNWLINHIETGNHRGRG
jgi:hypothetical protein